MPGPRRTFRLPPLAHYTVADGVCVPVEAPPWLPPGLVDMLLYNSYSLVSV